jgi:hypothetical protein
LFYLFISLFIYLFHFFFIYVLHCFYLFIIKGYIHVQFSRLGDRAHIRAFTTHIGNPEADFLGFVLKEVLFIYEPFQGALQYQIKPNPGDLLWCEGRFSVEEGICVYAFLSNNPFHFQEFIKVQWQTLPSVNRFDLVLSLSPSSARVSLGEIYVWVPPRNYMKFSVDPSLVSV